MSGFVCVEGLCVLGEAEPPGLLGVGPEGGVVEGPDGLSLMIPQGALATRVEVLVRRGSATTRIPGVQAPAAYQLEPAGLDLASAASLRIPATMFDEAPSAFRAVAGAWQDVAVESAADGWQAPLDRLGIVVLGVQSSTQIDAGVLDAAAPTDAGPAEAGPGESDTGFPPQEVIDAGEGPEPDPEPDGGVEPDPDPGDTGPNPTNDAGPEPDPGDAGIDPEPDPDTDADGGQ